MKTERVNSLLAEIVSSQGFINIDQNDVDSFKAYAGHGSNTPGKRSPRLPNGKQFFEWEFCREVVNLLYIRLKEYKEFTPIKITPESTDISLSTRVKRINQYCKKYGASNCIMISIHVNAAGNGSWMTGLKIFLK